MARQVCEVDPRPPSAALRTPDRASSEVRKLKGDLDHIVLMTMRKEPERRYSSAAALASDIFAYLNGYPVIACDNSLVYRARKFVSRHKFAAIAAMLLALSLAGFSGAMAVLTQRANQERLRAEKERLSAEREAAFLSDMFQAATPSEARGRTVTARELLDRGASRVDKELAGEPVIRASLLYAIAHAYKLLGLYDQAQKLAERSFELRAQSLGPQNPSTAESLSLVATATRLKGEYGRAEPLFRQALHIRQMKFGSDSTVVAESLTNLGECLYLEGSRGNRQAYGGH
jgi:eukaryotic-like serine/threonine-protein kinase